MNVPGKRVIKYVGGGGDDAHPEGKVEGETQAGKVDGGKGQSFFGHQVFDVIYGPHEHREAVVWTWSVGAGEGCGRTCPTMTRRLPMLGMG